MDRQDPSQLTEIAPSLQELANIMELNFDENDPVSSQQHIGDANLSDPDAADHYAATPMDGEDDDDTFFNDEFNPEKNRTIVSLQNSGFAKAAVVVGGSLAIISGGALLFQSQLPRTQVAQEVKPKQTQDTALATAQAEVDKAQQSESVTKAQLALAKQKDSLAQTNGTAANPTGKSTVTGTTSLSPIAATPRSRATLDSSNARPITLIPPASSSSVAQSPLQPTKQSSVRPLVKPLAVASIPTISNRQTPRQTLTASNAPVAPQTNHSLPSSQSANRAARPANGQGVAKKAESLPAPTEERNTIAANSDSSSDNNPFRNPIRRNAVSTESVQPATGGRSLRDYFQSVASNVATPGLPQSETTTPINEQAQVQQVTIPGMGNVAKNANREINISDKILQQVAWSLPTGTKFNNPNNLPSELPTVAQGNQSLVQGIQLAQSMAPANPEQPEPEFNSGANSARPSFHNSRLITNKSDEQKQDGVKENRVALNSSTESSATFGNSPRIAKSILVGTSAKGSTVTPILWNAGNSSTAKFILKLEEPIRDNTNQSAIPAGTQLVVMVKPTGANVGFAELEVISVIIQGKEFTPPVGMLTVRDDQNGLLIGEDYFKRNEQIASRDSLNILTGALGRVGQVLNQPSSTISSVGIGSTTTVTNQSPSILGAVLEGGFQSLPATWSQRNQQALQEIANKPNVYTIPQGRSVRIFVNQTLEF
jgi:Bacterial conjugation TrbI-like protein